MDVGSLIQSLLQHWTNKYIILSLSWLTFPIQTSFSFNSFIFSRLMPNTSMNSHLYIFLHNKALHCVQKTQNITTILYLHRLFIFLLKLEFHYRRRVWCYVFIKKSTNQHNILLNIQVYGKSEPITTKILLHATILPSSRSISFLFLSHSLIMRQTYYNNCRLLCVFHRLCVYVRVCII